MNNDNTNSEAAGDHIALRASDIEAAFAAGAQQIHQTARTKEHEAVIVVPEHSRLEPLPMRRPVFPEFLQATRVFHEPLRFMEYVNAFKDDNSRMWHSVEGVFTCVIDDHEADGCEGHNPRHGDHVAQLHLRQSPEWQEWMAKNQGSMNQVEFAEWIEDHATDFIDPEYDHMLAVATNMEATKSADFKGAHNRENGSVHFRYDEEVNGTVNGGSIDIPKHFQLGLRPFYGLPRYPVDCLFRYRLNSGSLRVHYKMLQPERIVETAIETVRDQIAEATGITSALGHR